MISFARRLTFALAAVVVAGCQASCRSTSQGSSSPSATAPLPTPPAPLAATAAPVPSPPPTSQQVAPPPTAPPPTAPPPAVLSARSAAGPKTRPQTKKECDACGGLWDRHGIAQIESCICKTKDGGRTCRDGNECEGQCLVKADSKFEVAQPGSPARGFYVGRCSNYETTFGCFRVIERGDRARGPQIEDEAARHICVD